MAAVEELRRSVGRRVARRALEEVVDAPDERREARIGNTRRVQ
jgi:hypothetical protein